MLIAYTISLAVTVLIMLLFNAAQPALLYIVPFVLFTSSGIAAYNGEFKELLQFEVEENVVTSKSKTE